jgi:hypothetical protein
MSDTPLTDASISIRTEHAGYGPGRIEVTGTYVEVHDCRMIERELRERISELEAERDAYMARYQWLADKVLACDYGDNELGVVGWHIRHCKGPAWIPGASIDAAIDAARSTQP